MPAPNPNPYLRSFTLPTLDRGPFEIGDYVRRRPQFRTRRFGSEVYRVSFVNRKGGSIILEGESSHAWLVERFEKADPPAPPEPYRGRHAVEFAEEARHNFIVDCSDWPVEDYNTCPSCEPANYALYAASHRGLYPGQADPVDDDDWAELD